MRNPTPQTQHSSSAHVPTTGDGLLVRLSGETVAAVRYAYEFTGNFQVAAIADRIAVRLVQRDIDAAERANQYHIDGGEQGWTVALTHRHDAAQFNSAAPSDSTTTGGSAVSGGPVNIWSSDSPRASGQQ